MGAAELENHNVDSTTSKPRERQFQVVPMPGLFTRGRWKCWDYREPEPQSEKKEILEFDKEKNENADPSVVCVVACAEGQCDTTTHHLSPSETACDVTKERESSTIVVTSIGPAPLTPQHGTPQSLNDNLEHYKSVQNTTFINQETATSQNSSQPNLIEYNNQSHIVTTTSTHTQPIAIPNVQPAPVIRTVVPLPEPLAGEDDGSNAGNGGGVQTPNVAAIDNKIEQAMDLVKTHLTFAVREEVEVLRHTITDLEARVAFLENENQMLRQYAPREVVANLTDLVQNKKDSTTPPPPATLPTLPPPKVPVGFCSSSFATTLNNVVSDVRQEMAAKLSKSPGN